METTNCIKNKQEFRIKHIVYGVFLVAILVCLFVSNYVFSYFWGSCEKVDFASFSQKSIVYPCLDTIEYGGMSESIFFYGWAFAETNVDNSDKYIQILLVSGEKCYPLLTDVGSRDDVTATFEEVYLIQGNQHGFCAETSTLSIPSGEYELYLYCYENESAQGVAHLGKKMIKDGRNVEFVDSTVTMPSVPTYSQQVKLNFAERADIHYCVDVLEATAQEITVSGWCFAEGFDSAGQTVYLLSGESLYAYLATKVMRPDVAAAYDNELYTQSGFHVKIPVEDLPEGDGMLTLLAEIDGVIYQVKTLSYSKTGDSVTNLG